MNKLALTSLSKTHNDNSKPEGTSIMTHAKSVSKIWRYCIMLVAMDLWLPPNLPPKSKKINCCWFENNDLFASLCRVINDKQMHNSWGACNVSAFLVTNSIWVMFPKKKSILEELVLEVLKPQFQMFVKSLALLMWLIKAHKNCKPEWANIIMCTKSASKMWRYCTR